MKEKLYAILNKVYGVLMAVSFFAGILPIIPFVIALIIGGDAGEALALFLYNDYYKWVIFGASLAVVVGLIAMYIGKQEGLSAKTVADKKDKEQG